MPEPAREGPEVGRQLHSIALKNRSDRQVQKNSIDRPAEENMIRSARPIRYSAGTKPTPPTAWRKAAVHGVVAVVAHEEVVALGHGEDVGVVGTAVRVDVQDIVRDGRSGSVSMKRLAVQIAALAHRAVLAARQVAHRALRFEDFVEDARRAPAALPRR